MRKSTFFAAILSAALLMSACSGGGNSFTGDSVFSGGGSSSGDSSSSSTGSDSASVENSRFYQKVTGNVVVENSGSTVNLYIPHRKWIELYREGVISREGSPLKGDRNLNISRNDADAILQSGTTYNRSGGNKQQFSIGSFSDNASFKIIGAYFDFDLDSRLSVRPS